MKTKQELVTYYEKNLEKVKTDFESLGDRGKDYIDYAQDMLCAVKKGGLDELTRFWNMERTA